MSNFETIKQLIPESKFVRNTRIMPLVEWIKHVNIVLRANPYTTKYHEYLDAILHDDHPNQTFRKAAQVCISTLVLIKSLWVAEHLGKKVVYYFQNDDAVSDFSSDRAVPIIDASGYLAKRVRETNRVGLRQIGPGSLYFRGLMSKGKVKSVDADYVILDELDEARESNVEFATDRLMHSDLQWVTALSQPSLPGFGIDRRFANSDQHYWHLICPKCKTRNCLELNWPKNFLEIPKSRKKGYPKGATHYRACIKCHAKLDMSKGEWIAARPSAPYRGYHLSQLYSQILSTTHPNVATRVMEEYNNKRKTQSGLENFTISMLGFPYGGGHARVTDELLERITGYHGFVYNERGCFMGVDQGDQLHIVIGFMSSGRFMVVHCEHTNKFGHLDKLMDRFGVHYCVCDAMPNKHSAKDFAKRHLGRVSIQYFPSHDNIPTLRTGEEPHESQWVIPTVSLHRTSSLDSMIDRLESGQVVIPSPKKCSGSALERLEDFKRHLKALVSQEEESASGVPRKVYKRGNNHYGMALNSAIVAAYELGLPGPGPMVMPVFRTFGHA